MSVNYYDLRNNNLIGTNDINVSINSALQTTEHSSNSTSISVFPNPASETLNINYEGGATEGVLLDLAGRTISKFDIVDNSTIDISFLKKGGYIIKIGEHSLKFMKI